MDILDDLTNKFMDEMDALLAADPQYREASAKINAFCEKYLTTDKAEEMNDLVGKLSSAVFRTASRSGMKLGAKITAGLLNT